MANNERLNITIDSLILKELKGMVEARKFPSVSFAIESIVRESIKGKHSNIKAKV